MIQIWLHYGGGNLKKFKEIEIQGKSIIVPKKVSPSQEITEICIGQVQKTTNNMPTYVMMAIFQTTGYVYYIDASQNQVDLVQQIDLTDAYTEFYNLRFHDNAFWVVSDSGKLIKLEIELS